MRGNRVFVASVYVGGERTVSVVLKNGTFSTSFCTDAFCIKGKIHRSSPVSVWGSPLIRFHPMTLSFPLHPIPRSVNHIRDLAGFPG